MSQPNDLTEMMTSFFPDNAPLPLEIHGLDEAKAIVHGLMRRQELLVEVDGDQIWVSARDENRSANFFITPQKAAAIGNAFLRFAELAAERAKEKNDG